MKRVQMGFLLLVFAGMLQAGETAEDILEKVRKKYDSIQDAELRFSQHVKFSMGRIEQDVQGKLFIKKDNKYRVEFEAQTIVTDGKTVWSYSARNQQVLIDNFKLDERSFSPEKILVAAPADFSANLLGREKIGKTDVVVLKLVPRGDDAFVKTLKLWVNENDWLMKKVELTEVSGKETSYFVNDIKVNIGLQDSRFIYQIPEGAEVVDLR